MLLFLTSVPGWEAGKSPEPLRGKDPEMQEAKGQEPDGSLGGSARETHKDLPTSTQLPFCPEGHGHVPQGPGPSCSFLGGKSEWPQLLSRRL